MKYISSAMKIIPALSIVFLFAGCSKKRSCDFNACAIKASASEITAVQNYLTTNSIVAIQDCSGLFYKIEQQGTGSQPDACSSIDVTYTGKLTNGTTFDQATSAVTFDLSELITSWRVGVPLLKAGGVIDLYVPPSLGYGAGAVGTIPGNSILVFRITLVGVH